MEDAAARIDAGITDEVVAQRTDMRNVTTFTIDPKDAKDFDDALSIRKLPNGNYEVGVHIADVTHYVKPDSIIDREARDRATSVYLVDRVVPMLPEHLCNDICSLRPDEDKLTYSTVFEMTPDARVVNHKIMHTVIRSNRRFTYEEAQEIIETGKGDYADEILTLDSMAKTLRRIRFENGSVDFARVEVRFDIDENGHPIGVYFKESKDANKLIEEFMLLANKTVAAAIGIPVGRKNPKHSYSAYTISPIRQTIGPCLTITQLRIQGQEPGEQQGNQPQHQPHDTRYQRQRRRKPAVNLGDTFDGQSHIHHTQHRTLRIGL